MWKTNNRKDYEKSLTSAVLADSGKLSEPLWKFEILRKTNRSIQFNYILVTNLIWKAKSRNSKINYFPKQKTHETTFFTKIIKTIGGYISAKIRLPILVFDALVTTKET